MVKDRTEATTSSGQHEQVAKLTARGRLLRAQFCRERLLQCQQHQGKQRATPTVSAAQLKAWGQATSISISMSRGVNTARSSSEKLFYSVTSILAWVKGRAEHEQVAKLKLTARGRLLRAQFWVPVRKFPTSPGFFLAL